MSNFTLVVLFLVFCLVIIIDKIRDTVWKLKRRQYQAEVVFWEGGYHGRHEERS